MSFVKVKRKGKLVKVKISDLTVKSISMIFKLDAIKGVYLEDEIEGAVILPDDSGRFDIMDTDDTYLVNGEDSQTPTSAKSATMNPAETSSQSSTSIGSPLSYGLQSVARTKVNPPPFVRPTFRRGTSPKISWRKSVLVGEFMEDGALQEFFQTILTMTPETSSVTRVTNMLKDQLNYDVTLLDTKHLRIVDNESTRGPQFWKTNRKIIAVKSSSMQYIGNRKRKRKMSTSDILTQLQRIVTQPRSEGTEPLAIDQTAAARTVLNDIFKCTICQGTSALPAASCANCCQIIGCVPCIEQWIEENSGVLDCPLCRSNKPYEQVPYVAGLAALLQQKDKTLTGPATTTAATTAATTTDETQGFSFTLPSPLPPIPYDNDEDENLPPAFD